MLEWLHFILGGCVDKGMQDSDRPVQRLIKTESRWKRKALSRWSSVLCVMRLPRSFRKSMLSLLLPSLLLLLTELWYSLKF